MSKRYPGKRSDWFGYDRYDFTVAGNASHVVVPKAPAPQRPWIWRARFPDAWPQADVALLAKGIHVA